MTRKPRVLRIITRLNVGGPATHVVLADLGLRDAGWETLLLHGDVEPDEIEIPLDNVGIATKRVPGLARPIRPVADLRAAAAIARAVRRFRPDIIHTHLSKAGLLGRSVALVSSRAARVHTFHGTVFGGYFGETASRSIVRIERWLGHRTHRVLALSERQRQELLDHRVVPPDRIRIVPLGLDLQRFAPARQPGARSSARSRLGISQDVVAIVAIGRLVPIKRLDRLIAAFAEVNREVESARLYLVGDGSERAGLEAQAEQLGLADLVSFAGWSRETVDWYAAADIVALTSDREGTPLALIEAAASGRPVVATDVGGVSDIVLDGRTGFVVAVDQFDLLGSRIVALAKDPGLRGRMGAEAPSHAVNYDSARLVRDLDVLYRELL